MTGIGVELGARAARSRALAVLRVRGRALGVALLPAAAEVILLAGGTTGRLAGPGWDAARWAVGVPAVLVLLAAAGIAVVVARARPAVTPTVPIAESSAPDLYRLVRELADRLDVPAPSAIALTPDCDSWLEDRTHPAHGPPPRPEHDGRTAAPGQASGFGAHRRAVPAPVLVIGSPFLWWMRVGELRAVLAPVVAGTGPSAQPDIAAARRFVRGLDAAVAVAATPGRCPLTRGVCAVLGWVARLLLRGCREHAALMERGVAAAAAERAQAVDYGLRIVAQEQVGLAYAGWDRLLTRVALPAWRMGRWPSRLDAGVVAALTELSRRDRLAEGFTSRLGERPACDLLEEPGAVDEAASLLAARLFHGGPAECGQDWAPVDWQAYPEEVVDRTWRADAARLHRVLDSLGVRPAPHHGAPDPGGATLSRVLDHLTERAAASTGGRRAEGGQASATAPDGHPHGHGDRRPADRPVRDSGDGASRQGDERHAEHVDHRQDGHAGQGDHQGDHQDDDAHLDEHQEAHLGEHLDGDLGPGLDDDTGPGTERSAALAAGLTAALAREECGAPSGATAGGPVPDTALWDDGALPLVPLQPPRTAREVLADHVTAMVCCAAVDTAGAAPALDWLDGPSLLLGGERAADLAPRVLHLIEEGDPGPLRDWLAASGIRPEKPVRLV
ncbi:hypothetical protein AQJ66_16475 [Streptomyces bungoensis]|uniref:Uncharacterized protein n=1 Tax=Streptomyces bungoensis TaxID=285568 RepID=A0A101T1I0_9ACTN|nr:hypothetical protein [Streptomyces bungoensis]KUN84123.1 hypothetical protein AQJ66_16475 [Streptomyces bungoensis]